MTGNERHDFVLDFAAECIKLMRKKGDEYAVDGDVNGNFKRIAAKTGQSVYQVWYGHFQKHMDAIENFVKDPGRTMAEPITGRVQDAINYMLILPTLIEEDRVLSSETHYKGAEEDDGNPD